MEDGDLMDMIFFFLDKENILGLGSGDGFMTFKAAAFILLNG